MKLIIKEGLYTKNSPANSSDAIKLALNTSYIDGVFITIQKTKDNVIVVYPSEDVNNIPINSMTYSELALFNIESGVKRIEILTLNQVLKLYEGILKKLVIDVPDYGQNNQVLINSIINIINNYPNVDIYLKLIPGQLDFINRQLNAKIGIGISEHDSSLWNLDVDFYAVSIPNVSETDKSDILVKLKENKIIMLENIMNLAQYQYLQDNISNYDSLIYVVTNQLSIIASSLK